MGDNAVLWIIVAVLVIALIVGLLLMRRSRGKRQVDKQRQEAERLRREAEADRIEVQRREAEAARIEAEAKLAQAEADRRAADAAELAAQARERAEAVAGSRSDVDARLRRADELDPDVPGDGRPITDGAVRHVPRDLPPDAHPGVDQGRGVPGDDRGAHRDVPGESRR